MLRYSTYQSIYEAVPHQPVRHKFNIQRLFSKTMIRIFSLSLVMIITCTGMITAFASSNDKSVPAEANQVIVQPGDTLWSIASMNKAQGDDIRSYIHAIIQENDLPSSEIQAGDVLVLPSL